ncbi:MAG: hypothetical protein P1V36_11780 [Planctomycetota bacterium]|nr:hypothetical protein [Planctomycetota bacterium]
MTTRLLVFCAVLLACATGLHAEELVVRSGKAYRGFPRRQGQEILLNEYGCSAPEMTLGVRRLRAIDVRETRPWPLEDHLQRELLELGPRDVARRVDLMRQAQSGRQKAWTLRLAAEILAVDGKHAEALRAIGGPGKWEAARRGNPHLDGALSLAIRRLLRFESGGDRRDGAARLLKEHGYEAGPDVVERMVRSLQPDRGLVEGVKLRLDADGHPGSSYALYVPPDYDPLEPRPLLVVLHGGGMMQAVKKAVRGSPKDALALYQEDAARLGWFLLCPQALESPWGSSRNLGMLEATLAEVQSLWNIDLERVHLAGQGGGADGAWFWAARKAERFASVSIATGGKPVSCPSTAQKTALWVYHGEADEVVPIAPVRKAAEGLRKKKGDFVYCELPREGHGLAPAARRDMFRYIAPKRRRRARTAWPRGSFSVPSSRHAVEAFGDPAAAWGVGFDTELDAAGLVDVLAAGRTDAEHAARRLVDHHVGERDVLSKDVRAFVRDKSKPLEARVWAAWLSGRWRDPQAINELGDVLRGSKDTRLLRFAAEAVGRIGSADSTQDLRWALADISKRYRSLKGNSVPFQEYERTCRLGATVADALGLCAQSEDLLFAELEENLVRHVLMDRRPVVFAAQNGEDPSEPRSILAESLARSYRRLNAEATLFAMLLAAVKKDKRATQAVRRGMRRGR